MRSWHASAAAFGTLLIMSDVHSDSDELSHMLATVARHGGCALVPPAGHVTLPDGFALPDDLRRFYELCGGAVLFEGAPFEWRLNSPQQLVPASPRLLG